MVSFIKEAEQQTKQENTPKWFDKNNDRESILIYGHPKSGKTWSYCSIIKEAIDNNHKIFVLSTDDGLFRTFRLFFGNEWENYAQKINYYSTKSINEGSKVIKELINKPKKDDWLIIDLMSDFWEMAQDRFVDEASKNNPEDFVVMAQKDMAKFGLLDSNKWNYCKKLDNIITQTVFYKFNCNIIGIAGVKDVSAEEKIGGKQKAENDVFRNIGYKPGGQKYLRHRFNTIIYVGGEDKKYFRFAGDRGFAFKNEHVYFMRDFWSKVKQSRVDNKIEEVKK